ncbi:MAG TPA: hypothetical protein VNJ01_14610 [Bacteriovoracaceae bacterium]|nr:hypothetical protein [Bacteriovoracaceae bacterium]
MKIRNILPLFVAFLTVTFSTANAGVLVEPLIGYNFGTDVETSTKNYDGSGAALGARLGYQNLGFQLGVDYLRSAIDLDSNDFSEDLTMSEWAGFIGFEFPILLRVYAGYIFSASGETESAGQTVEFTEGSGTKLGVGFTGLPFVVLNLEYRAGTFDAIKTVGPEIKQETDYNSYLLSLSLPLNL